jgi:hypothetical protein
MLALQTLEVGEGLPLTCEVDNVLRRHQGVLPVRDMASRRPM